MKLAVCWVWLIIITAMLVFSIYFVALGFTGDREDNLKEYDVAVDSWNRRLRPRFEQLHMRAYEESIDNMQFSSELEEYTKEPVDYPLDHDRNGKLPEY